MMAMFREWGRDLLVGGAVAALALAVMANGGQPAVASLGGGGGSEGLTCDKDDVGLCKNPNTACTAENGSAGTCTPSQGCPCKPNSAE
jgi:hypothetical protein